MQPVQPVHPGSPRSKVLTASSRRPLGDGEGYEGLSSTMAAQLPAIVGCEPPVTGWCAEIGP